MEPLVLYIAKKAGIKELKTSTRRISLDINISQQTISRKLRELESNGVIFRSSTPGGVTVKLTENAVYQLKDEYSALIELFESTKQLEGKVLPGMGEGGYYMHIYAKKFRQKLGFMPYSGTLNIDVDPEQKKAFLLSMEKVEIPGFKTKTRTFGAVYSYNATIIYKKGSNEQKAKGALIVPVRARHPDNVAEIIAPFSLRKKFGLKNNDTIIVQRRTNHNH